MGAASWRLQLHSVSRWLVFSIICFFICFGVLPSKHRFMRNWFMGQKNPKNKKKCTATSTGTVPNYLNSRWIRFGDPVREIWPTTWITIHFFFSLLSSTIKSINLWRESSMWPVSVCWWRHSAVYWHWRELRPILKQIWKKVLDKGVVLNGLDTIFCLLNPGSVVRPAFKFHH